jgi:proteasome lid subunit RPN8/RPN11
MRGLPHEACGLLAGVRLAQPPEQDPDSDIRNWIDPGIFPDSEVKTVYPTANMAASARIYEVDPREHLRADRDCEARGEEIIGVFHSHTHTDPYPSPTDVAQAPDPGWHYVLVSLRHSIPSLRSFRIVCGNIFEETVVVLGG